jgi:hypothetical protein
MIQHDRAQTAMAREIQEIPLSTERLLAEQGPVAPPDRTSEPRTDRTHRVHNSQV